MNREELQNFIAEKYGVLPEYLWASSPSFAVFATIIIKNGLRLL